MIALRNVNSQELLEAQPSLILDSGGIPRLTRRTGQTSPSTGQTGQAAVGAGQTGRLAVGLLLLVLPPEYFCALRDLPSPITTFFPLVDSA